MSRSPLLSVAIAAIYLSKHSLDDIRRLFESLAFQTFRDFEVVLSDQSQGDEVQTWLSDVDMDIPIQYLSNAEDAGYARRNLNYAIAHARGTFIKPMDMDDFFCRKESLEVIAERVVVGGTRWAVVGFDHLDPGQNNSRQPVIPSLSGTLGSPSAMLFANDISRPILFDNHLLMTNDHALQQDLLIRWGPPLIMEETLVTVARGPRRISNFIGSRQLEVEHHYIEARLNLIVESTKSSSRLLRNTELPSKKKELEGAYGRFSRRALYFLRSQLMNLFRLFRARTSTEQSKRLPLIEISGPDSNGQIKVTDHRNQL